MSKEYSFYVTDEQRDAIRELGLSDVDVSFCTSGMVHATVFGEYDITCYTLRKNGEVVKESRTFTTDGWETDCRDHNGVWTYEAEVV